MRWHCTDGHNTSTLTLRTPIMWLPTGNYLPGAPFDGGGCRLLGGVMSELLYPSYTRLVCMPRQSSFEQVGGVVDHTAFFSGIYIAKRVSKDGHTTCSHSHVPTRACPPTRMPRLVLDLPFAYLCAARQSKRSYGLVPAQSPLSLLPGASPHLLATPIHLRLLHHTCPATCPAIQQSVPWPLTF